MPTGIPIGFASLENIPAKDREALEEDVRLLLEDINFPPHTHHGSKERIVMESWTAKDWAEFLGAVSLFVSAILTAIWGKNFVVGASTLWKQWQEIRNAKYEQRLRDEELNDKGHKFIIRRLDKRVTELEKALEAIRTKYELQIAQLRADYEAEISLRDKEHMRCREEYAALKVEAASLRRRVEYLEKERRKS